MKCLVCGRQLLHCAVPGVPIGPTCAKRRGLMPASTRRQAVRIFSTIARTPPDPAQMDWVNLINHPESPWPPPTRRPSTSCATN